MTEKTLNYIKRAKEIHGDKYDYSLIEDIKNNSEKIEINCQKHGIFEQKVLNHIILKQGCPSCAGNIKLTNNKFIEKSIKIHGEKYNYDKVDYRGNHNKVIITCFKHGDFLVLPYNHLQGVNCEKCIGRLVIDTESFINQSKEIYKNLYNYEKTVYLKSNEKVIIICKKHGDFLIRPSDHIGIHQVGCQKCSSRISKPENEWLNSLKIKGLLRQYLLKFKNKKYIVDGYDPKTKTIYEFYGDYFHGNPQIYESKDFNKVVKKSFEELYLLTLEKEKFLIMNGYKLNIMWEAEWKKLNNKNIKYYKNV